MTGNERLRARFLAERSFPLDDFQVRALDAIDEGRSVLVAAPTGAGKTLVAEYAIAAALDEGGKTFYTTPLKALSNQKYGDLARMHGADSVGLLTGDNVIKGDAPIVVMTTEVLRNMIYAGSPTLEGLRYVVLDEVHYLQDRYRGAVWEEVIIHLRAEIAIVALSATVSNAEEVADWMQTVRGETEAIIEERRPVELRQLYMVGERGAEKLHLLPTFVGTTGSCARTPWPPGSTAGDRQSRPAGGAAEASPTVAHRDRRPARRGRRMLPAIVFRVQPRAGCDQAVEQCLDAGIRLTDSAERVAICGASPTRTSQALADADLDVLGYDGWLAGLRGGRRRASRRPRPADEGGGGGGVLRGLAEGGVRRPRRSHSASTCRRARW